MHGCNVRYSARSRMVHEVWVRYRRPCRRRGCSWGGGRGSCEPGRSASWCEGQPGGRRSGRRAHRDIRGLALEVARFALTGRTIAIMLEDTDSGRQTRRKDEFVHAQVLLFDCIIKAAGVSEILRQIFDFHFSAIRRSTSAHRLSESQ